MDTRGISSSRDQYNWGAYYKSKEKKKTTSYWNVCKRQATNEPTEERSESASDGKNAETFFFLLFNFAYNSA